LSIIIYVEFCTTAMLSLRQPVVLIAFPVLLIAIFWSSLFQDSTLRSRISSLDILSFSSPRVSIRQGHVVGTLLTKNFPQPVEAFMGLPYCQPPTGDRRFRAAASLPASNKTFKALNYGPM
jgi:triacylglycerol lipase